MNQKGNLTLEFERTSTVKDSDVFEFLSGIQLVPLDKPQILSTFRIIEHAAKHGGLTLFQVKSLLFNAYRSLLEHFEPASVESFFAKHLLHFITDLKERYRQSLAKPAEPVATPLQVSLQDSLALNKLLIEKQRSGAVPKVEDLCAALQKIAPDLPLNESGIGYSKNNLVYFKTFLDLEHNSIWGLAPSASAVPSSPETLQIGLHYFEANFFLGENSQTFFFSVGPSFGKLKKYENIFRLFEPFFAHIALPR